MSDQTRNYIERDDGNATPTNSDYGDAARAQNLGSDQTPNPNAGQNPDPNLGPGPGVYQDDDPNGLRPAFQFYMTGVDRARAVDVGDQNCGICMEPLHEDVVLMRACGHFFHTNCVLQWFEPDDGDNNNTCPLCRTILFLLPPVQTLEEELDHIEDLYRAYLARQGIDYNATIGHHHALAQHGYHVAVRSRSVSPAGPPPSRENSIEFVGAWFIMPSPPRHDPGQSRSVSPAGPPPPRQNSPESVGEWFVLPSPPRHDPGRSGLVSSAGPPPRRLPSPGSEWDWADLGQMEGYEEPRRSPTPRRVLSGLSPRQQGTYAPINFGGPEGRDGRIPTGGDSDNVTLLNSRDRLSLVSASMFMSVSPPGQGSSFPPMSQAQREAYIQWDEVRWGDESSQASNQSENGSLLNGRGRIFSGSRTESLTPPRSDLPYPRMSQAQRETYIIWGSMSPNAESNTSDHEDVEMADSVTDSSSDSLGSQATEPEESDRGSSNREDIAMDSDGESDNCSECSEHSNITVKPCVAPTRANAGSDPSEPGDNGSGDGSDNDDDGDEDGDDNGDEDDGKDDQESQESQESSSLDEDMKTVSDYKPNSDEDSDRETDEGKQKGKKGKGKACRARRSDDDDEEYEPISHRTRRQSMAGI